MERNRLSLKFGCLWLVDLPMENGRIKEHHIFSVYSLLSLLTVPVRTQALWQMYLLRDQLKKLLAHGLCHPTLMHHTIATWSCLLIQMCLFSVRSTMAVPLKTTFTRTHPWLLLIGAQQLLISAPTQQIKITTFRPIYGH